VCTDATRPRTAGDTDATGAHIGPSAAATQHPLSPAPACYAPPLPPRTADVGPPARVTVVSASFDDVAGEPRWSLVGGSVAGVTTRSVKRLKLVTQGSPAASFDLHHNAAIRYTSEPVSTSAAMALFDAQKRLLLEKIKALEVV